MIHVLTFDSYATRTAVVGVSHRVELVIHSVKTLRSSLRTLTAFTLLRVLISW